MKKKNKYMIAFLLEEMIMGSYAIIRQLLVNLLDSINIKGKI
ncbi:hypothetical protein [Saccharolobus islandicus]|nr:hypothetical protein [Sulfolobus islandicus]